MESGFLDHVYLRRRVRTRPERVAAQTPDEKDVLAAVQKTFDGMAANDGAKILASMTADARLYGVRVTGAPYAMPAEQWANRIASLKSQLARRLPTTAPRLAPGYDTTT